jgi:hypothetical protein
MKPKQQKHRRGPDERDQLILEHVAGIDDHAGSDPPRCAAGDFRNAIDKIANRLCDAGLLQKTHPAVSANYFVLGELAVRQFGIGIHRADALGSQSLPQEFALLAFATLGVSSICD